jgi:hypothetical protein
MKGNYEKYNSILGELVRKIGKTNNMDNMLKYNKDCKSFLDKFNEIIFNFKDEFLEKSLKKMQEEKLRVFSYIEIYNEFEIIKVDLLENIYKDLPKKRGHNYFFNRLWNGIFLSVYKDMQYFTFSRNDSLRKKPEVDGSNKFNNKYLDLLFNKLNPLNLFKNESYKNNFNIEYWALMTLDYGIKKGDYRLCYEALGSLKGYEKLTGNLEKKLTMIIKRDLFKDLIKEHSKI